MKKLLTFVAVAAIALSSAFALDLGDIKGTWKDVNYDANWTFSADGKIILTDAAGDTVFTFTDTNVSEFRPEASSEGVGFSFYCKETGRKYKFLKPITLSTDLTMDIDRDWTDEGYNVSIKLQK